MNTRTVVVVAGLFVVLGIAGGLGAVQQFEEGDSLTERWVSDTARDTLGNHHAPTAVTAGKETLVVAPVNGPAEPGNCGLIVFNMELEEQWRATVPPGECNIHAFGDPTVADLDEDDRLEVFVATTEELVHAYDLRTGEHEFSRELAGWGYAAPLVANFTAASGRELIVPDLSDSVSVFSNDGSLLWRRNLSGTFAPVFVEDFTADGDTELAIGSGHNVTLLEADGTILRQVPVGGSITWLTAGQADSDPAREIVAATTTGRVVAVDGRTGAVEWSTEYTTLAAVYAFGDGDSDGQPEVYAVAQDGKLRAIDASDGRTEWTTTLTTEDVQMTPPPALGDLTGDGSMELVAVSQDGLVAVVDPASGEIIDSYERDVPIWMRPTLVDLNRAGGQDILVVYGDGRVVALSYDSTSAATR